MTASTRTLSRYAESLALIVVATVARQLLDPYLGEKAPYATYMVVAVFVAWLRGLGPALLAVILGALLTLYLFVPPRFAIFEHGGDDLLNLFIFVALGAGIAWLIDSLRTARRHSDEQREWLRVTLRSIGDGVIVTDDHARITFLNAMAESLTGWTLEEAQDRPLEVVFRIIHEHTRRPAANPVDSVLREGVVSGLANHTVLIARDGTERSIADSAAPIRNSGKTIGGVVLVFRDITEQQRAEQARAYLAAIVESSDDAIVGEALDGVITSWNRGAERIFGYTADAIVGQPLSVLMPPDTVEDFRVILDRIRRGEHVEAYQTKRLRKDGQVIDVSLAVSPIRDAEGQIIGASKVARDITALKRQEAELRQAKEAAELANRAKDQFLAMLSHELRTPLAPVLLETTAALSDPTTPAELLPTFRNIRDGVQLQARLVDDLLDVTRIIRGKMVYHFEVVDIHETVQRAWKHCLSDVQGKQQRVALDLSATQHHVQGDPTRLQQLLFNLLKNASKFSPEQCEIRIKTTNAGDRLIVSVIDPGIGIEPEYLPRVFDAFDQGEETIKRRLGGLGLGLGISRAIAEAHGGILTPASDGRNRGSTFTLDLPAVTPAPPKTGQTAPPFPSEQARRKLRVLLVEDDPATANVTERLLRQHGYEVATAGTIAEALDTRLDDFQVMVCDIGLPDGNGFDLMRQVKARCDLPSIALTGFGMDHDIERSRKAGFTAHLVKPIDFNKLDDTIQYVAAST